MATKQAFWAARPFGYAEIPMLDVGQVVEIVPGEQRNDEKLIRLGLLREVGPTRPVQCGKCGARFVDEGLLNRHGRNRHDQSLAAVGYAEAQSALTQQAERAAALGTDDSHRDESPGSVSTKVAEAIGSLRVLESEDKFAEANIPLNLENSKANKEGRSARRASR